MTLDDALTRLDACEPEYGADLSSHVPMVVEALDRLGRGDRILGHLEAWWPRLRPRGQGRSSDAYWRRVDEAHDAIAEMGARGALLAWFDRVGPGLVGGAFHGTLWVALALRGASRAPSPARDRELAHALAYAHVMADPLPAMGAGGERPFEEVFDEIAPRAARAKSAGLITPQLHARVPDLGALADTLGTARLPADPRAAARVLRDVAAHAFVQGAYHPTARFTLLHGVTGMDAVCALVEVLPEAEGVQLTRHAAVALAALWAAFGGPIDRDGVPDHRSWEELRDDAVATGDDHAIKLASTVHEAIEAGCDPRTYLAALGSWVDVVGRNRVGA
jgi:hypothetical protein